MIPRGTLDIGWRDLLAGLARCVWSEPSAHVQRRIEACWSEGGAALVCLSVRSGLDLLLQALALPPGSEVLISAITIPDIPAIIRQHGLVPIPLDIDPATLSVDAAEVAALIGPRTRAILVAHLFGSRMPLGAMLDVARQHRLLLIEDCAQVYDGRYHGDPAGDVSLFSFGPIKTATALGGALVRCNDPVLAGRLRLLQSHYRRQPTGVFLRRLVRFGLLKLLARPLCLSVFVAACRLARRDHDQLINGALRSFGGDLLRRIRCQPSAALLHLLERRLRRFDPAQVVERVTFARRILARLPAVAWPGAAAVHCHWVLPILSDDPERLTRVLWACGFDATRKASSLAVVAPPPDRAIPDPIKAHRLLARLVYLPMYHPLPEHQQARLARIVREVETTRPPQRAPLPEHVYT